MNELKAAASLDLQLSAEVNLNVSLAVVAIVKAAIFVLLLLPVVDDDALGRDQAQRRAFLKSHPCPSTGKTRGACAGFVVDHIKPLCAGGADRVENMQWQSLEESKKKDRLERQQCRRNR